MTFMILKNFNAKFY